MFSAVVFTSYQKKAVVACPDCLGAEARRGLWTSALLGWWGVPWGPIRTIQSISVNLSTIRSRSSLEATPVLRDAVRRNPGASAAMVKGGTSPLALGS